MKPLLRNLPFAAIWIALFPCFASPGASVPAVTIGQNFLSSTYGANSSALPPDANGAVGPVHFVEFINGSFTPYYKTNGQSAGQISDTDFWGSSGVVLPSSAGVTDPRIIYDWASQRWFASMVDLDANAAAAGLDPALEANNFLIAVSDDSDPNGTWHGFRFRADPVHGYFADFPTLGVDSNAVYISGDFYHGSDNELGPGLVSIPKADLLAATPTIANRTRFSGLTYSQVGQILQPVTCFDGSVRGRIISLTDIGNNSDLHSNLVSFAVQNAGGPGATLTSSTFVPTPPWEVPDNIDFGLPLLTVTQPDGTSQLEANDARISAKVYGVGGVVYAVHNTEFNNRVAIRWYRVRASDNTLLESGTIADPDMDLVFPSIAANASGVVVIAFNGCSESTSVSSFCMAGQTIQGVTIFGSRLLLQAGVGSYHGDDELYAALLGDPAFSRWGDYSATSVDPSDPNRFWTIQIIPTDDINNDVWSTQITELITVPVAIPLPLAIQRAGTNVTLSWTNVTGFQLQSATSLNSPVMWSNVVQTPVTNGNHLAVTVSATATRKFFRLNQQ